jgi:hypothetical protein
MRRIVIEISLTYLIRYIYGAFSDRKRARSDPSSAPFNASPRVILSCSIVTQLYVFCMFLSLKKTFVLMALPQQTPYLLFRWVDFAITGVAQYAIERTTILQKLFSSNYELILLLLLRHHRIFIGTTGCFFHKKLVSTRLYKQRRFVLPVFIMLYWIIEKEKSYCQQQKRGPHGLRTMTVFIFATLTIGAASQHTLARIGIRRPHDTGTGTGQGL